MNFNTHKILLSSNLSLLETHTNCQCTSSSDFFSRFSRSSNISIRKENTTSFNTIKESTITTTSSNRCFHSSISNNVSYIEFSTIISNCASRSRKVSSSSSRPVSREASLIPVIFKSRSIDLISDE